MQIRRLSLDGFRCLATLDLSLPPGRIVVAGRNGQGKSSLLEAVYALATTRAAHAPNERDLIGWEREGQPMPFARAACEIERGGRDLTLELVLTLQREPGSEARLVKRLRVNGAPKRPVEAIGVLHVVLFTPRDLDLVDGAPAQRRRYLDVLLCQLDREYTRALSRYNRLLTQRNHLLRRLRERTADSGELEIWDHQLASEGGLILARRLEAVRHLEALARDLHADLVGAASDGPALRSSYVPGHLTARPGPPADAPRALADALLDALRRRRSVDVSRAATTVGPHRDDVTFTLGDVDVRQFGSRGQQRSVAVAWKLAEARLMHHESGEDPVLLLDDVLSELDAERRDYLLAAIPPAQQSFLTTTDPDRLGADYLAGAFRLDVEDGRVRTP